MNFEYFIAKRFIDSKSYKSSVSAPIIKIGIVAIAIGMIVMLIAIATGIGLQQKIRDKVVAFNGHITIENYDNNNSKESVKPISKTGLFPEFYEIEGISHVQPVASKLGVLRTETDFEAVILKGVDSVYNWHYFKDFLVAGNVPDYSKKRNEDILISQYLAKRLGFSVGDKCNVYFAKDDLERPPFIRRFTIVGIYNSGYQDFDAVYVIGDLRHIQKMNKWDADQIGNFEVFIDDFTGITEKTTEVYQNTPSKLNVTPVSDTFFSVFEWISIFDKNIYGIIGIMILIAGINMITALLVLILERTQVIGVLKALGSSNWSIRKMFLYNAAYLILRGLFWGNLIGLGVLLLQKQFKLFPLNPDVYYVTEVPVYINLGYVAALNVGTFILCLAMLLIPSFIITKISPSRSIRFQ